jgi:hypothetical protein
MFSFSRFLPEFARRKEKAILVDSRILPKVHAPAKTYTFDFLEGSDTIKITNLKRYSNIYEPR